MDFLYGVILGFMICWNLLWRKEKKTIERKEIHLSWDDPKIPISTEQKEDVYTMFDGHTWINWRS